MSCKEGSAQRSVAFGVLPRVDANRNDACMQHAVQLIFGRRSAKEAGLSSSSWIAVQNAVLRTPPEPIKLPRWVRRAAAELHRLKAEDRVSRSAQPRSAEHSGHPEDGAAPATVPKRANFFEGAGE